MDNYMQTSLQHQERNGQHEREATTIRFSQKANKIQVLEN